ncbi:hypothetical protein UWK_01969 [Desulfocapsa sulfexigens DSM 10523]|uniref:Uncharacterized protein n=1 Tax=Desulfocapsa sulfexigens (strain DSM 10523 / SB164P1) TaxID=1167006 RepID=M1NFV0_DESSD|nr:hypothetical protein [Desulfocapsa sulfexigens]AGF78519.1 hypothetical protein UWK_01969 [Desulfocapsa sulfexigens DSM 10523]
MKIYHSTCLFCLSFVFIPATAFAYVGPGTGLSAIGSLLALIFAVVVAILGFLWFPIKRLLRKKNVYANESLEERLEQAPMNRDAAEDNPSNSDKPNQ